MDPFHFLSRIFTRSPDCFFIAAKRRCGISLYIRGTRVYENGQSPLEASLQLALDTEQFSAAYNRLVTQHPERLSLSYQTIILVPCIPKQTPLSPV